MLGSMASNPRRWHGVQLSIVILLQLVSATSGRTAPSSPHQQAKGIYAAANNGGPVADTATSPDHLSTEQPGKEAVDVQVFDFSFSQSCPYPVVTRAEEDQEQVEQDLQQQSPPAARALSLRECSLGDAGLVEIARSPWVRGRTAARALSLRSNQITAVGVRALLESLRLPLDSGCRDNLAFLELDFNPLGDGGVQRLPAYLKERAARGGDGLEELSLRFCDIGPAGCRYISSALIKAGTAALTASKTSAKVPPSGESDGDSIPSHDSSSEASATAAEGARGDAESVLPPPAAAGIRRLLLTGNHRLGDAGARALASALKKDRSLEVLDLTRCKIGDDGARFLAEALRANTSLRELRLGYNDISADGASALAALLHAGSSALETLELQGNHVGDAGAIALANSLAGRGAWGGKRGDRRDVKRPRSGGLRSLNLAGNGIGWAGGVALAEALAGGGARGRGGRGRGGGGEVTLEELELAGNPLTLSAALAAQAKKNSSIYKSALYKSAGGALSSLLNTFVDESYYSGGSSSGNGNQHASSATCSSPNSMNAGTAGVPPRCAVAELGIVLAGGRTGAEDPFPSLRAVGLGRTGMTDRDAARLARSLRARSVDSPLEEVEVGMNGLSARAAEAVRLAVQSPAVPQDQAGSDDFEDEGREERRQRQQQQQRRKRQKTRRPEEGREGSAPSRAAESSRSKSRSGGAGGAGGGGGARRAAADERAAAGRQVGEFVPPGGSVELGMFGKKFASFRQERGSGGELEVDVFGKRVRLERPVSSRRGRSSPPPSSPPSTSTSSPPSPPVVDSDPWSDDEDDDFGAGVGEDLSGVSDAATHGSSWSHEDGSDSSSSSRDSEEDSYDDDDDDDDDDEGDEERGGGSETDRRTKRSPKVFAVRGGGGSSGGGEPRKGRTARWVPRSREGSDLMEWDAGFDVGCCSDDDEWAAGFEPSDPEREPPRKPFASSSRRAASSSGGGGGGVASADMIEWEAGFEDGCCSDDTEWAAGFEPSESEKLSPRKAFAGNSGRAANARGGGGSGAASAGLMEWEPGFDDDNCSDDTEWAAGFTSSESEKLSPRKAFASNSERAGSARSGGGGAASSDLMEWEAGFDDDCRDEDEWAAGFESP